MAGSSFRRRKSVRGIVLQGGFLALIAAVVIGATLTARDTLAKQGLTSGFGFLRKATGWEMNFSLLPTTTSDPYWWYLLMGLLNTLFMGVIGLTGASVLGLVVGLMRSGRNPAARLLATLYIELFRNLPLILQLFFWYAMANALPAPRQSLEIGRALVNARGIYLPGLAIGPGTVALAILAVAVGACVAIWVLAARRFRRMEPQRQRRLSLAALGAGLALAAVAVLAGHEPGTAWTSWPALAGLKVDGGFRVQPEVYALAIAIMTYGAAYVGEIVRGGFKAVGRGQMEAAAALGLSPWQIFSRVRMPLAFRAMLPILINQYVWLIKATTLGIAVGFSDFFMVIASSINHSGQTFEFIAILMGGFLLINFTLAAVLNRLNRAIALKGHQTTGVQ
ncbi:ABC transporter permease subunit [Tabrizicola sp.]|uniref:ABC transporter permease subunit n=1 Tax=Tabrizicola sp. TaxID=2005166 RepID=UPI002FDD0155